MKMTVCILTLFLSTFVALPARGQVSDQSPDLSIANRPAKGRYTIVFTYTKPLPEWSKERLAEVPKRYHPRRLIKVEGASDGKTRQEIRTWSDGTVTEAWALPGITLFQNPALLPQDIQIFEAGSGVEAGDGILKDFTELAWTSEENYRKRATYKGRPADHYAASSRGGEGEEAAGSSNRSAEMQAWIDPQTRLPIAMLRGAELREYSFTANAPAALTPSRVFQEFMHRLQKLRGKPPGSV